MKPENLMKDLNFSILILALAASIAGCVQKKEHKSVQKTSDFRVAKHYFEFANKMENGDTLNIGVVLSMCMWREHDKLQITKLNDSLYLELKEKMIMEEQPLSFKKVHYKLKNDSLNLQKMIGDFDENEQNRTGSPFFVITNPKEKDKIILRTSGLGHRGTNIERYQRIMLDLYPKEMEEYRNEYFVINSEPFVIEETKME